MTHWGQRSTSIRRHHLETLAHLAGGGEERRPQGLQLLPEIGIIIRSWWRHRALLHLPRAVELYHVEGEGLEYGSGALSWWYKC